MSKTKEYIISFSSLRVGEHEFDFQISDSFFEVFEHSRIQKGNLSLKINMTKAENLLQLQFNFKGIIMVVCDHCGDDFDFPLDFAENLIVKFSDQHQEDTDEVVFLPTTSYQINLAQFIYEFVNLALPMRITHPEDENDNPTCVNDVLDEFEDFNEPNNEIDPRWDALKKLK